MLNRPIFITGCARSGTSMVAGIIHMSGAWGGSLSGPTRFNPKGQFENVPIVNGMVKPFLTSLGYDPLGQEPLPDIDVINQKALNPGVIIEWRLAMQKFILSQGYPIESQRPWFYKGAKMCLIWPIWDKAYSEARWVIVHRRDNLTIDSCLRTAFMRKRRTRKEWSDWIYEHKKRFAEMVNAGLDIHMIDSEKIVNLDFREIIKCVKDLGLFWNQKKVTNFVDPRLWHIQK